MTIQHMQHPSWVAALLGRERQHTATCEVCAAMHVVVTRHDGHQVFMLMVEDFIRLVDKPEGHPSDFLLSLCAIGELGIEADEAVDGHTDICPECKSKLVVYLRESEMIGRAHGRPPGFPRLLHPPFEPMQEFIRGTIDQGTALQRFIEAHLKRCKWCRLKVELAKDSE